MNILEKIFGIGNNNDDSNISTTKVVKKPEDGDKKLDIISTASTMVIGEKKTSITKSDMQNVLDKIPFATPYVTSYHRKVTEDGETVDAAYLKRYYSVIDAEIYFGNEYVEDICYIDWNVNQNTMPLFGYNSYRYDEVAQGSRLIQGVFDINFTSPNYLFQILKSAQQDALDNKPTYSHNLVVEYPEELKAPEINTALTEFNQKGSKLAPIWTPTFDIDIIFGNYTGVENAKPVHIILQGVYIQSCSMVMSASAAESPPSVRERYTFIAKDFRTYVGKPAVSEEEAVNADKQPDSIAAAQPAPNTQAPKANPSTNSPSGSGRTSPETSKTKSVASGTISRSITGTVLSVHDGDTCKMKLSDGRTVDVRLYGIDTPEDTPNGVGVQPFGKEAGDALREMINGKTLKVDIYQEEDGHGRPVVRLFDNGVDVNAQMVQKGLAWHYVEYDASNSFDTYEQLMRDAKDAKLGLWSQENPVYPDTFRKGK